MEQTTVCAHDVVGPGAHLPAAPVHGLCMAVLQPRLVPWEEVSDRVIQALLLQDCCNPLILLPALWYSQLGVEISDHHNCGPLGPLADGRNNVLYGRGIVWGKVAPHNVALPVS